MLKSSGRATTVDELLAHCRERLARYKVPKTLVILDDLPRNASGKILKRALAASLNP